MFGKYQALKLYGSSGGNLVEGSPPARHTKAFRGPYGVFGPAAIGTLDLRKLKIEDQNESTVPERFVQVLVCTFTLLLTYLVSKNSSQTSKLNAIRNLMHRSEISFFWFFFQILLKISGKAQALEL